ncbi:MAG: hypothetical protein ACJA2M_001954 [Polaribacter sp.]|jgi:hypothetical protein
MLDSSKKPISRHLFKNVRQVALAILSASVVIFSAGAQEIVGPEVIKLD